MKAAKKPKAKSVESNTFADTLMLGMCDVGFTDETLAEVTHFSPDTIYRFRTGKLIPPLRTRNLFLQAITARRGKP